MKNSSLSAAVAPFLTPDPTPQQISDAGEKFLDGQKTVVAIALENALKSFVFISNGVHFSSSCVPNKNQNSILRVDFFGLKGKCVFLAKILVFPFLVKRRRKSDIDRCWQRSHVTVSL
uniref:Uncharacterized protein n=1 Tax=Photinus pyralis TaxID=7054 RepID=A0A1Y1MYS9_PHOPY